MAIPDQVHGPGYKASRRAKRKANWIGSLARLDGAGIAYEVQPRNSSVTVEGADVLIDYWPSTGFWVSRADRTEGRGVFHLIDYVRGMSDER